MLIFFVNMQNLKLNQSLENVYAYYYYFLFLNTVLHTVRTVNDVLSRSTPLDQKGVDRLN